MTRQLSLRTADPADTRAIGGAVATVLRPGDIIALTGELGAGKTCLVQGAATGLGVAERVTSPTFLLRRDYEGRLPLVHLDVYRLDRLADVADLGFDEALAAGAVVLIEWGDAVRPLLPPEYLEIELTIDVPQGWTLADGEPARELAVQAHGASWDARLDDLAAALGTIDAPPPRSSDAAATRAEQGPGSA